MENVGLAMLQFMKINLLKKTNNIIRITSESVQALTFALSKLTGEDYGHECVYYGMFSERVNNILEELMLMEYAEPYTSYLKHNRVDFRITGKGIDKLDSVFDMEPYLFLEAINASYSYCNDVKKALGLGTYAVASVALHLTLTYNIKSVNEFGNYMSLLGWEMDGKVTGRVWEDVLTLLNHRMGLINKFSKAKYDRFEKEVRG